MVELQGGSIVIDGVNIRDIGLDALRGRLALVPQDRCVVFALTAVLMLTHIKVYYSSARYERICESASPSTFLIAAVADSLEQ
jgi:ABC-type multidrug transport system fused ATPase/permease subunit